MLENSSNNLQQDSINRINLFLQGRDPMEHIIAMEGDYQSDKISIIYVRDNGEKRIALEGFRPFAWAKQSLTAKLFGGDRKKIQMEMRKRGIACKALQIKNEKHPEPHERLINGFKYLFYATRDMSYNSFLKFFNDAGTPLYPKKKKGETELFSNKDMIALAPIEQHMIRTGKRLFKNYDYYDDLKRLIFDLETQGLNPRVHAIDQIGIRTNKGYEKIISVVGNTPEERKENELKAIIEFLCVLRNEKPDIVIGHNSENFDWNFIIVRCEVLGTSIQEVSEMVGFNKPIHKRSRKAVLKLGGEMEDYFPTVMWGHNIIDSLHAVRRAQAIDSSMQSASLKYVTKYLKQKKDNRVYVPGEKIGQIWLETDLSYAFNNEDGCWYKLSAEKGLDPKYELTSGRYIVERYLLDDLWETDKVELKLNEANFLVSKIIPTSFTRACTMGTAGIWKLIMLAWAFENDLAVPDFAKNRSFTGGLSRLLKTGFVKNIVKLDYNSLYPSIILTWMISTGLDISDSMLSMLNYVLTERERFKKLKKQASKASNKIIELFRSKLNNPNLTEEDIKEMKWKGIEKEVKKGNVDLPKEEIIKLLEEKKKWDAEESANDKKQLPLKILGNSYFGSFGCPAVFPFGDLICAEKTTCIGRMSLRLMISHFTKLGYEPIVGDSFTADTPLFVRDKISGMVDIRPISELINESEIKVDALGREYDYSKKSYQVLCRSGWYDVKYVYRHKVTKPIYRVEDNDAYVDVTEDHSLFNDKQQKIKPSEINEKTKLEYYNKPIITNNIQVKVKEIYHIARMLEVGFIDRVPEQILNGTNEVKAKFMEIFNISRCKNISKTLKAQINFIKNNNF